MRILTIMLGTIYILSSAWCCINTGKTFAAMAFILGLLMILQGVGGLFALSNNKEGFVIEAEKGYFLTETLISLILGILLLSNLLITDMMIPVFFGTWMIFIGISRLVSVFLFEKEDTVRRNWKIGLAILSVVYGIYAFFNPNLLALNVVVIAGLAFAVQGSNIIYTGISMPKADKENIKAAVENNNSVLVDNKYEQTEFTNEKVLESPNDIEI